MHERNHFPATANKKQSDLNSMQLLVIYKFSCTLLMIHLNIPPPQINIFKKKPKSFSWDHSKH